MNRFDLPLPTNEDINVLVIVKGFERYVFVFNTDHEPETLRTFGRYASNPDLSFTWYDAAVLSQRVRQVRDGQDGSTEQGR